MILYLNRKHYNFFTRGKNNDDSDVICVAGVKATMGPLWSIQIVHLCIIMYIICFEGGRPVLFTSRVFTVHLCPLISEQPLLTEENVPISVE